MSLTRGVSGVRLGLVTILVLIVLVAMMLTSSEMSELRWALPLLSRGMNWLEFLPVSLDMDHVVFFTGITFAARLLLPHLRWWWLLLGVTLLGAGTEVIQFWVPGRTPKLLDARDDVLGGAIGLMLGGAFLWLTRSVKEELQLMFRRGAASVGAATVSQTSVDAAARLVSEGGSVDEVADMAIGSTTRDLESLLRALHLQTRDKDASVTEAMIAIAQEQGVAKLLYDLILSEGDLEKSAPVATILRDIARQETALELARLVGIRQVLGCLSRTGHRVLLLKGSALAYWLYDNPAQRTRCDLDILVADKPAAMRAITALQEAGYTFTIEAAEKSAEFEAAVERRLPGGMRHHVDLHWRVLNHARLADGLTFADLDSASVAIPSLECKARGLGIVHAMLHALLHRITNMPSGRQNRLIWLYDIHLLAMRCRNEDWDELSRQCVALKCATPCLDGLRATRTVFATPIPEANESALRRQSREESWLLGDDLDRGVMDRDHLAALSWLQKAGWLRRKLFPSRQFMRHRYAAEGGFGLAKAYLLRWMTGLERAVGWQGKAP